MGLFRPGWQSNNEAKALKAVEKLSDEAMLVRVAYESSNSRVRIAALKKLTNQAILAGIAKNECNDDVCKAAIEKLTDQAALADVAKNCKNSAAFWPVLNKLTDQNLLFDLAKNCKGDVKRSSVVVKLTDQAVIEDFALHDTSFAVRRSAIECLTKQIVLEKIAACADENDWLRIYAGSRLQNHTLAQAVFLDVAQRKDINASFEALSRLRKADNEVALKEVVKSGKLEKIRLEAISYMKDKDFLLELLPALENPFLSAACGKLGHIWDDPKEHEVDRSETIDGRFVRIIDKEWHCKCSRCGDTKALF